MVHVKLGVFTPGESGTEADCFDSLEWARSLHAPTFSINPYQRYDSVYAGISPFFRLCASVFSKSSNIFFPPLPFFFLLSFRNFPTRVLARCTRIAWVDEGNVGAGCCVGSLCLLFGRLLRGMMVSSWLGEGGGTKDVFVKEIVPGDLKWGLILIEIVLMGNIYIYIFYIERERKLSL